MGDFASEDFVWKYDFPSSPLVSAVPNERYRSRIVLMFLVKEGERSFSVILLVGIIEYDYGGKMLAFESTLKRRICS
jgi:hypothetical protein